MKNLFLLEIAEQYFADNIRNWRYITFYFGPLIPKKMLNQAQKSYAPFNTDREVPILLMDCSFFLSVEGIVITNEYIYYKLLPLKGKGKSIGKISMDEVDDISIQGKTFASHFVINGVSIAIHPGYSLKSLSSGEAPILNGLFKLFSTALRKHKLN